MTRTLLFEPTFFRWGSQEPVVSHGLFSDIRVAENRLREAIRCTVFEPMQYWYGIRYRRDL